MTTTPERQAAAPAILQQVEIGGALLILGDSEALRDSGQLPAFDALVCDPPYGINFRHSGDPGKNNASKPIIGDDRPFDPRPWVEAAKGLPMAFFGADHFRARLPESGGGFLCWDKSVGMGPNDNFADAEFAWMSRRTARCVIRHLWKGWNREGDEAKDRRFHVSQKPVAVMQFVVEALRVRLGSRILDPYMGSGSTGVAAIRTGRRFVGIELDPDYFATACQRIQAAWDARLPEAANDR